MSVIKLCGRVGTPDRVAIEHRCCRRSRGRGRADRECSSRSARQDWRRFGYSHHECPVWRPPLRRRRSRSADETAGPVRGARPACVWRPGLGDAVVVYSRCGCGSVPATRQRARQRLCPQRRICRFLYGGGFGARRAVSRSPTPSRWCITGCRRWGFYPVPAGAAHRCCLYRLDHVAKLSLRRAPGRQRCARPGRRRPPAYGG